MTRGEPKLDLGGFSVRDSRKRGAVSMMRVNTRLVSRLGVEWPSKLDRLNPPVKKSQNTSQNLICSEICPGNYHSGWKMSNYSILFFNTELSGCDSELSGNYPSRRFCQVTCLSPISRCFPGDSSPTSLIRPPSGVKALVTYNTSNLQFFSFAGHLIEFSRSPLPDFLFSPDLSGMYKYCKYTGTKV